MFMKLSVQQDQLNSVSKHPKIGTEILLHESVTAIQVLFPKSVKAAKLIHVVITMT